MNNRPVRIDDDQFINLTDMWRATGSDPGHRPWRFLSLASTKKFVARIEKGPVSGQSQGTISGHLKVIKKEGHETYAHRYVAYKYAGHIDTEFEIHVYDVLDAYYKHPDAERFNRQNDIVRRLIKQEHTGSFHGHGLNDHRRLKRELIEEAERILNETQLKINLSLPPADD